MLFLYLLTKKIVGLSIHKNFMKLNLNVAVTVIFSYSFQIINSLLIIHNIFYISILFTFFIFINQVFIINLILFIFCFINLYKDVIFMLKI